MNRFVFPAKKKDVCFLLFLKKKINFNLMTLNSYFHNEVTSNKKDIKSL